MKLERKLSVVKAHPFLKKYRRQSKQPWRIVFEKYPYEPSYKQGAVFK